MDVKALAEAARLFSDAAYETTYGNWVFESDEYDNSIDLAELEDALFLVGDPYLLWVDVDDGRIDLTLSTYYMKDGYPGEEYDSPYSDDTESEWADAWDTAAACRLFSDVFEFGSGWVKQEGLITYTLLGEYVPCNEAVLDKCKALFADCVKDTDYIGWKLYLSMKEES